MATTSTLILNNLQVGQNLTPTNNLTFRNPETGTVYLSVGNANATTADIMSFNTANSTVVFNGGNYSFGITPVSGPAGGGNYSAEHIWYNGSGGTNASIALKTSRGTVATPLTTVLGDVIGNIDFYGYNSNVFAYAGAFDCVAAGTWTIGSTPTSYNWNLCPAGSITTGTCAVLSNIGTGAAPLGQFQTGTLSTTGINANQYSLEMLNYGVSGSTFNSSMAFKNARGSSVLPAAVTVGDSLGDIDFYGYNGSLFNYSGSIQCMASNTFTNATAQTQFNFLLTPANSLSPINAATLDSTGTLLLRGVYVTQGTSTTTTIPTSINATLGTVTAGYSQINIAAGGVTGSPDPAVAFISSRGTTVAPTATQTGDLLGNFDFFGYGTAWAYSAGIDVVASGIFSGTSTPSQVNFNLTPVNATAPATTYQMMSTGYLNVGNATNPGGVALGVNATAKPLISGTAPTVSSGFGTGPSITANGTLTFRLNVGTGGTATSGVIALPTATNGWNAIVQVFAPTATNLLHTTAVTASTTTSVTLTNYTTSTGAAVAWPASTVLIITCVAY